MSIHLSVMRGKLPSKDALAEAERWYVRLKAPDCPESVRAEFHRWLLVPEHAAAYAASERLWKSIGRLAGRPDFEQLSQRVLAETENLPRRRQGLWLTAACVLLALLGGAAWRAVTTREVPALAYAAKRGERATVALADRSQLVLNSETELEVRLGSDARRVSLQRGEALFTVAHDEKRPFKVTVGDGEVTALGTRFQVRRDAEQVTVTLLEGRITVDRGRLDEHTQLEPGDQVRFTVATPQMERRVVDPEVVASWSTGRLRFRGTPLADVLGEVNRYSETQIRVTDPALARTPISGTFQVGDSTSVVSALEALLPVRAVEATDEGVLPHVTLVVPR